VKKTSGKKRTALVFYYADEKRKSFGHTGGNVPCLGGPVCFWYEKRGKKQLVVFAVEKEDSHNLCGKAAMAQINSISPDAAPARLYPHCRRVFRGRSGRMKKRHSKNCCAVSNRILFGFMRSNRLFPFGTATSAGRIRRNFFIDFADQGSDVLLVGTQGVARQVPRQSLPSPVIS